MIDRSLGNLVGHLTDFLGSLWVLMSLAIVSQFQFKGRYWTWRTATAFPQGTHPEGKLGLLRSGFEYARWAWRIRRLR